MRLMPFIKLILAGAAFYGLLQYGPFQDNLFLNVIIAVLFFFVLTAIGAKKR